MTATSFQLRGLPASPGRAIGRAVVLTGTGAADPGRTINESQVESEIARFHSAVQRVVSELKALEADVRRRLGAEDAAIFAAQQLIATDAVLEESVVQEIAGRLVPAERACERACEQHARALLEMRDPYLYARAADVQDVGRRLVRCLAAATRQAIPDGLPADTVLIAPDLTPSDTAALDTSKVVAVVLDYGGMTSHTAILARSLGIPAVVAAQTATSVIRQSDVVLVDAVDGIVEVNPGTERALSLTRVAPTVAQEGADQVDLRDAPGVTRDGRRIKIVANIGTPGETLLVQRAGGEGVGLFRSEFLLLDRDSLPAEDEQYGAYRAVLSALSPLPVTIRTFDIRGDKAVPYLDLEVPDDSSHGLEPVNAGRFARQTEILRTHLRALLRASTSGNLRIMFPMIGSVAELRAARGQLDATRDELLAEGALIADDIPVGIMVEVPSAAEAADELAQECDFFSIGTNDLVQYTLAADRTNSTAAHLSTPFHPSVLRLIARAIDEAHKHGIWAGMCGEMAGDPVAVPLLVGMGIDELSMAPVAIPGIKHVLRNTSTEEARRIFEHIKTLSSQEAVMCYLQQVAGSSDVL